MEEISPAKYFAQLKEKKNQITDETLCKFYDNCLTLLNKYQMTGQVVAMRKLIFQIETIEKERQLVQLGINTFVYRDDVENYIDNVSKNVVKIIELSRYEREVPDEVSLIVEKTKNVFDQFYVLFTDYTGKMEKQVAQERREKDPILFGTFQDEKAKVLIDRFYFLGDWIDDYCDLTLDRMAFEAKQKTGKDIRLRISTPKDIQELKKQLDNLIDQGQRFIVANNEVNKKKTKFGLIRSFFRGFFHEK